MGARKTKERCLKYSGQVNKRLKQALSDVLKGSMFKELEEEEAKEDLN